ncbi:CHC2 zinc finger domain-containing protein [Thiolapillus sp.]|uniref:CHC2 zinc finger domain-containing protein n=1 Tax=Thiolapillus sp. TaxID=2017437 RepID=UPI003AF5F1C7
MLDAKRIKSAIDPRVFYQNRVNQLGTPNTDGWADGGLCLWHGDKRPGSFKINVNTGHCHCFSCGAHGDIIDFAMQQDGTGFSETLKNLANEYGIQSDISLKARQQAKERALLVKAAQFEEALLHD